MSRFLWLAVALLVASCGGKFSPPRDIDDACAIIRERPSYFTAMKRAEREWGVPVAVQMAIIYQESKFVGNARTPHRYALGVIPLGRQSSAYGYSQALDGTWDEYQAETRSHGARRDRIDDSVDFIGWYMAGSSERLGIELTDVRNQYLAYHEGRGGYARGSYRSKGWLQQIAAQVSSRAENYHAQLIGCGRA
ncbi:MAG: lytic transglycosylase [Pseudorhodobacter sp.]|nr:lytic transglycosylase [Pseudorhodobacter sp.]